MMDREHPNHASRPPMPETFRYRAPAMVPVWLPHDRDWILVHRWALDEFFADYRAAFPDRPTPEAVHDSPCVNPADLRNTAGQA